MKRGCTTAHERAQAPALQKISGFFQQLLRRVDLQSRQQTHQLGAGDGQRSLIGRGEGEGSLLQPLVVDGQARSGCLAFMPVEPEYLGLLAIAAAEDEQVATERVLAQ